MPRPQSLVAMLLGIGAMVAGARSGGSGADIGMAAMTMPQAHHPEHHAGLYPHPGGAGRPGRGEVPHRHRPIAQGHVRHLQAPGRRDPVSSRATSIPTCRPHPMPKERVAALEELVKTSPYWDKKDSPELQFRHDMMRAKLYGFMDRADIVARTAIRRATSSLPARYARAIAAYRFSDPRAAHGADRRPDRGAAAKSLFPRAQGPGAAGRRQARRGDRAAAPRRPAGAQSDADPGHARAGADREQRPRARSTRRSRCSKPRSTASRIRPRPTTSWPWRMAARATSPMPISPPRSRRSRAAT